MKYALTFLLLLSVLKLNSASAQVNTFGPIYSQSEKLLVEKKYGEFGDLTTTLLKLREDEGYANLVPLSERLIESGRESCSLREANCSFFIKSAVLLSPTDPWTLFSAATQISGLKDSVSYFFNALWYSTNSPTFFFKAIIVLSISLLALTSLFIVLKLLFRVVRFELEDLSPRRIFTFSVLLLIGLPFGLISSALCWSVILLLFVGRKREILQVLLLTLAWIAFLPTAENIVKFVSRPEEREFELLLSKVASPSSELNAPKYLREPIYLGTKYYQHGDFEKAREQFLLANTPGTESSLVALARLVAAELALKNFADAKVSINNARERGLNSYESVHNEAILAAATTNLNESRQLLDKLKQIDSKRLSKASPSTGVLLEPVSLGQFADRYLEPIEGHLQGSSPVIQWISNEKMLAPLCSLGLAGLLVLSALMSGLLIIPTGKLRGLV